MSSQYPIPSFFFSFVQSRKPSTPTPSFFKLFFFPIATVKSSGNNDIFWTALVMRHQWKPMRGFLYLVFVHLACFLGSFVLYIAVLRSFVCGCHTGLCTQHLRSTSLVCLDFWECCCLDAVFYFCFG